MGRSKYPYFYDYFGVKIRLGDTIVYPVRSGSQMWMTDVVVCEVPGKGCTVTKGVVGLNANRKRVIIQNTSRCVVVKRFELEDEDGGL